MLACMAFNEAERDRLLERISIRYGMHRTTLARRLQFLGVRFISPNAGVASMEKYQQSMLRAIKFEKFRSRIRRALMTKIERMKERQVRRLKTTV
jgi:hypothetical protein